MSKQYGGFSSDQRYRIIEDSLVILSTYFGVENDIEIHRSMLTIDNKNELENDEFTKSIHTRFFLAKWIEFRDILGDINSIISSTYEPTTVNFVGKIQGTILVSEYINRKWSNSGVKNYPCLISDENYDTPENAFLYKLLEWLYNKIKQLVIPQANEDKNLNIYRKKALSECVNMIRHPIFESVRIGAYYKNHNFSNLIRIIKRRNSRGQTVNLKKYKKLISWYESLSWSVIIEGGPAKLSLVFGYGSEVWDKVFEIWVLSKLIGALSKKADGEDNVNVDVLPLTKRGEGPIAFVKRSDLEVQVLFQNSKTLTSEWYYDGGNLLRGIPDILINIKNKDGEKKIFIDVKNIFYNGREDGNTEKYKMLGYFESYRKSLNHQPKGILIFRNDNQYLTDTLKTKDNASLRIYTVSPDMEDNAFDSISDFIWSFANEKKTESLDKESAVEETLVLRTKNAESLAKELAINNPEELKKCKEDLRRYIFGLTWDYLPAECQTLLGMAELLYQSLEKKFGIDPDIDWGPVVLEFCRAAEYFLNHKVLIPFIETREYKNIIGNPRNQYIREYSILSKGTLTFGELSRFFKDIQNSTGGVFTFIQNSNFLNQNKQFWKANVWRIMSEVNNKYRKKSAHIDLLTYEDIQECRAKVLGNAASKGLITSLLGKG